MNIIIILLSSYAYSFGILGHRIVGEIAQKHISKATQKKLNKIAGNETLAMMANWPDFMKSDREFSNRTYYWHFVTIPDGMTYETIEKEPKGDIVESIGRMIEIISDKNASNSQKLEALRFLVHFIGDIHQPLHVGLPDDRGGNDVKVRYFGEMTNLHHIWDENLIKGQELSFTEYANEINHAEKSEIKIWENDDIHVWIKESMELRKQAYSTLSVNKDGAFEVGYRYSYDNIASLNRRLLQAGIRLAFVLDKNLKI